MDDDDEETTRLFASGFVPSRQIFRVGGALASMQEECGLLCRPAVDVVFSTSTVELLLLSVAPRPLSAWRALLQQRVPSLSLQVCMALPDPGDPACVACAERMIQRAPRLRGGRTHEHLLDAYKVLSGGFIHLSDPRDWRMTSDAMQRMSAKREALGSDLVRTWGDERRLSAGMRTMLSESAGGGGDDDDAIRELHAQYMAVSDRVYLLQTEFSSLTAILMRQTLPVVARPRAPKRRRAADAAPAQQQQAAAAAAVVVDLT